MASDTIRSLLCEGLDLCVRARQIESMERRKAALDASADAEGWQASGNFDRYVARNNIQHPEAPIHTKSATIPLWAEDQYQRDLADWEKRARAARASVREGQPK